MKGGITRRRMLGGLLAAGAIGAVALFIPPIRSRLTRKLDAWYAYREAPVLPDGSPGTLRPDVTERLALMVESLVGHPLERQHYEAFFRWRAENLRGYRDLYLALDERLRWAEARPGRGGLATTAIPERRAMIAEIHDFWSDRPDPWSVLFRRRVILFRTHFVDEVLDLFGATDAWTILGYRAWPGTPRGHDHYPLPPGKTLLDG